MITTLVTLVVLIALIIFFLKGGSEMIYDATPFDGVPSFALTALLFGLYTLIVIHFANLFDTTGTIWR